MKENSQAAGKIIARLVLTAVAAAGIGAVVGAYNSESIQEGVRDAKDALAEAEEKCLPYMPQFMKDGWNGFGNIHFEKYDTLEERYEANRKR